MIDYLEAGTPSSFPVVAHLWHVDFGHFGHFDGGEMVAQAGAAVVHAGAQPSPRRRPEIGQTDAQLGARQPVQVQPGTHRRHHLVNAMANQIHQSFQSPLAD